jgi:hypothetical protein
MGMRVSWRTGWLCWPYRSGSQAASRKKSCVHMRRKPDPMWDYLQLSEPYSRLTLTKPRIRLTMIP